MLNVTTQSLEGFDNSGFAPLPAPSSLRTDFVTVRGYNPDVNALGPVVTPFLFCATAQDLIANNGLQLPHSTIQRRNTNRCFMVGFKESLTTVAIGGGSWRWRRICFTKKGLDYMFLPGVNADYGGRLQFEGDADGQQRMWAQPTNAVLDVVYAELFEGTANRDWNDVFTAKVTSTRVTVKYDKVRTISNGNDYDFTKSYRMWHKMRKNLVYNDDEQGDSISTSKYSVRGKEGMGDYYILDLFIPATNSSSQYLRLRGSSTLYWHER